MGLQKMYTLWGLKSNPEAVEVGKLFQVAFLGCGRVGKGVAPKPLVTGSNPVGGK